MKKVLFLLLVIFLLTGCSKGVIGCSGCVYSYSNDIIKVGDKLDKYEKDYNKLNNDVFLGAKIDKNQKIKSGYICVKDNEKVFCLEGNNDGSKYESNKKILDKVYNKQCKEKISGEDKYYTCNDVVNISTRGIVYVGKSKSNQCYAYPNGNIVCYDGMTSK